MSEGDENQTRQLSFLPSEGTDTQHHATTLPVPPDASLTQAIGAFELYMEARGFTENTQQAFRLDMQRLSEYLGPDATIDEISTVTLNAFLRWMEAGRGIPCSPKTLERRITTLKVFFGWLADEGVLTRDIAAPLIHRAASAPLPEILDDTQIAAILRTTEALRQGNKDQEPDARPHLLITLILSTGIKKSECTNIQLNHLDLSDPQHPALWIRYKNPRRRHKERRIPLPVEWPEVLDEYLAQYPTRQYLFPWTGRNLEYVLTRVATATNVPRLRLTFGILRWTCAVRDYIEGMDHDALRRKLGLSEISWYEAENRLDMLARQYQARIRRRT